MDGFINYSKYFNFNILNFPIGKTRLLMRKINFCLIFAVIFVCSSSIQAQQTISLFNPSFEDYPRQSFQPRGWLDCGGDHFRGESPPDTQPGSWNVRLKASDGGSYLGLVVRDVETWESVGQRLMSPIKGGKCYSFAIDLCKSSVYVSQSQATGQTAAYTKPVVFRIWGSNDYCNNQELLGESSEIDNTTWQTYDFKFEPKGTFNYIILEAFYKTPTLFPYNGNLLIDNAQDIVEISCSEDTPVAVAKVETPRVNQPKPKKESVSVAPKVEKLAVEEPKVVKVEPKEKVSEIVKPKVLAELDKDLIKEGQVIRIKNLEFKADSSNIDSDSHEVLDEIYTFLKENENVTVEIGGHTNTKPKDDYADMLSEKRAKAVVDYLLEKGIDKERMSFKGYGKRKPIIRKDAYNKIAQRKNQRVEIKILSM